MTNFKNIIIVILLAILCGNNIFCQEISGKVLSSNDGEPLIGATVIVKGTNLGAVTDINGKYKIKIDSLSKTLSCGYLDYYTKDIDIGGRTTIDISLEETPLVLEKIIITEYIKTTYKPGDILSIIKVENTNRIDTIKFNVITQSKDSILKKDSVKVSEILPHKIAMDSLPKYYIIDKFSMVEIESLWDYLFAKIHYPHNAREYGISGLVYSKFTIDTTGLIKNIEIQQNIDYLGDEVYNALTKMPKWLQKGLRDANVTRGKSIEKMYILPIVFEIKKKNKNNTQ